jgi:hypothetical protein
MSFDTALEELASADADLREIVRILCGMATFAALIGREDERDRAVEVAANLLPAAAVPRCRFEHLV